LPFSIDYFHFISDIIFITITISFIGFHYFQLFTFSADFIILIMPLFSLCFQPLTLHFWLLNCFIDDTFAISHYFHCIDIHSFHYWLFHYWRYWLFITPLIISLLTLLFHFIIDSFH
jgi:hypothetical protein